MSFMDIFKKKTQNREITTAAAAIFDKHNMMIGHIADLEQGINRDIEDMRASEWSQSFGMDNQPNGLTKVTRHADTESVDYEFLVYKGENEQGQMVTQYYDVTPIGDFSTPHHLAAFTLKYNAYVNGQYMPCEATVRTNGASVNFVPVDPREVKPMDPEADKKACMPDPNDVTHILTEYARVMGIELDRAVEDREDAYTGLLGR